METQGFLEILSTIIGWIYFFAWSISFYGQIVKNYRRKSVSGFSFDFCVLNILGFSCYLAYNIWGFIDENMGTGKIRVEDVAYASHAFLITLLLCFQVIYYYDKNDKYQSVNKFSIIFILCAIWGFLLLLFEEMIENYDPHINETSKYRFNSLVYLSWVKIAVSLAKFIPQIIINIKRKSTIGWSAFTFICDLIGGSFSSIQIILDLIIDNFYKHEGKELNIGKFALGLIGITVDIIFLLQHFVYYKDSNNHVEEVKKENEEKLKS